MNDEKLKNTPTDKLLLQFADILDELKQRGVARTRNNPVADYAESLVAKALGLTLERNSNSGFDAKNKKEEKFQIKGRRLDKTNKSRQLSVIRNLEQHEFDFLVGVLFDRDFSVLEAYKIPHELINKYARINNHQHGHILQLKGLILKEPSVEDITDIVNKSV
jgi:hypothetical protein